MLLDLQNGFYIRSYKMTDAESIAEHANNYNIYKNLKDRFPYPYILKDAEDWIEFCLNQEPLTNFAIANDKEAIGTIGAEFKNDVYRCGVEIGYWVAEKFWGKGIATSAVKAFAKYLFENYDIERVAAGVFSSNHASAQVLKKAGFKLEGTLRKAVLKEERILDLNIYSILKEDFDL